MDIYYNYCILAVNSSLNCHQLISHILIHHQQTAQKGLRLASQNYFLFWIFCLHFQQQKFSNASHSKKLLFNFCIIHIIHRFWNIVKNCQNTWIIFIPLFNYSSLYIEVACRLQQIFFSTCMARCMCSCACIVTNCYFEMRSTSSPESERDIHEEYTSHSPLCTYEWEVGALLHTSTITTFIQPAACHRHNQPKGGCDSLLEQQHTGGFNFYLIDIVSSN